jgi:hypothetical protein
VGARQTGRRPFIRHGAALRRRATAAHELWHRRHDERRPDDAKATDGFSMLGGMCVLPGRRIGWHLHKPY